MRGTSNLEHRGQRLCGKAIKTYGQVAVNFRIKLWGGSMKWLAFLSTTKRMNCAVGGSVESCRLLLPWSASTLNLGQFNWRSFHENRWVHRFTPEWLIIKNGLENIGSCWTLNRAKRQNSSKKKLYIISMVSLLPNSVSSLDTLQWVFYFVLIGIIFNMYR